MSALKHALALALLTVAAAASSPLSAAQIGGPVAGPRPPGGSWLDTWTAIVCWDERNPATGLTMTRCTTLFANTLIQCNTATSSYLNMGGRIVQPCAPSSP
ncbi:MAG: hypothetical protein KA144_05645 [Xanthomonadaceae bacterium]|nr:hypothetical protein [Xanthomonadaceae bacterium]